MIGVGNKTVRQYPHRILNMSENTTQPPYYNKEFN